jgi:hypothetical protein
MSQKIASLMLNNNNIIANKFWKVSSELSVDMRIITVAKVEMYFPHVVREKLIDKMIHLFALNFVSSLKE